MMINLTLSRIELIKLIQLLESIFDLSEETTTEKEIEIVYLKLIKLYSNKWGNE